MGILLSRIRKLPGVTWDALRSAARAVPWYSRHYPKALFRAVRYFASPGFPPHESLELGLLDPDSGRADLEQVVSKREMETIQESLNPSLFKPVTENKAVFYLYCAALGLPIPRLYALYCRSVAGHSPQGVALDSPEAWRAFIANDLPTHFVVKRARGAYGRGLIRFTKTAEGRFVDDSSGTSYDAAGVYDLFVSTNQDLVIQERVFNHADLRALSGTDALQTIRVWTLAGPGGQSRILHAHAKVIVGQNVIDNNSQGRTGNLQAKVDAATGTLAAAVNQVPRTSEMVSFPVHPETGAAIEGFVIPLWEEVCELVMQASVKLLPARLIGWDIAVTPDGPSLIEANIRADPPNQFRSMGPLVKEIIRFPLEPGRREE